MKKKNILYAAFLGGTLLVSSLFLTACGDSANAATGGISPQKMADGLHLVMKSDRTIYTRNVVNRLVKQDKVINASEHWADEKALPLPAQMFRMGAEMVAKEPNAGFSYSLQSIWPINAQNAPKTEAEKAGLQYVIDNPGQNYYAEEELGGVKYFTGVYADTGVAAACVDCHNEHKDSPKTDFKLGDVMGGVVIRIPLD
ncbi:DUF3365 domain-containing protein [Pelagicoccus sp. SDUM812005]|uniref:Tll0287-like domain-containing protein n=1 Tax=Pelagicoccus sp. SDUM812005 TaxID=3041257 RepID=UPI00280E3AFF|nr:DUF3365 domain-containing protein [Pelagicoccus sp. SDUM812005]MDQ8179793.1 DUF3365 domain-containing protein [Pelagicoccus sp. SDUM812005]